MKVIIAGSRNFTDYESLVNFCDESLKNIEVTEIVSGCCKGADKLGELYATQRGYKIKKFPPKWKEYGRAAGPLRNTEMAKYGDVLIAFPIPNNPNKGTYDMIAKATENNLIQFWYECHHII